MPKSRQIKLEPMVLTQLLVLCLSKVRRTFVHTLDTWGGQGSWRSSSGGRPRRRLRRDCDLAQPRHPDGGIGQSNRSSCWGEAGRSPDGAGTFPLLCSASWTDTPTWHPPSGGNGGKGTQSLLLFGNILIRLFLYSFNFTWFNFFIDFADFWAVVNENRVMNRKKNGWIKIRHTILMVSIKSSVCPYVQWTLESWLS